MRLQFKSIWPAVIAASLCLTLHTSAFDEPMFTEAQKIGYLGKTSRSALARSVYERLKNQTEVRVCSGEADRVLLWHEILLDSIAIDHTPDPDTNEVDFVQGGPCRTSRALAMTQISVYDAVNSFDLCFEPYHDIGQAPGDASIDAAIAYAMYQRVMGLEMGQGS